MQRAPNGDGWVKKMNLGPAREHGDLVHLLPAGQLPDDPSPTIERLKYGLETINVEDYLLLVGDMRAIAWAVAIATKNLRGRLRILVWHPELRRYEGVYTELFPVTRTMSRPPLEFKHGDREYPDMDDPKAAGNL